MREISASQLKDLLNEGFDGKAIFEGRAVVYIRDSEKVEPSSTTLYQATGVFEIHGSGRDKNYHLRLQTTEGQSELVFDIGEGKEATYASMEKSGEAIGIPLAIHQRATLQLNPRSNKRIWY